MNVSSQRSPHHNKIVSRLVDLEELHHHGGNETTQYTTLYRGGITTSSALDPTCNPFQVQLAAGNLCLYEVDRATIKIACPRRT